ncbi:hypothetical protein CVT25_001262 [Psilocybe cyanescens]|uniref:HIT-type domain-containing protein n=1 Tax=Psilocybe cyanescens TaxID=93625 RepID=A0A409XB11_PSICY|nr:hypothetical protein CVT25_001262 [Psilocybe cyanescens]
MKITSLLSYFSFFTGLALMVQARVDYDQNEARDYIDELTARDLILDFHARSEFLAELETRELIEELESRLERRAKGNLKPIKVTHKKGLGGNLISKTKYKCPYCSAEYDTVQEATDCSKFCKAK